MKRVPYKNQQQRVFLCQTHQLFLLLNIKLNVLTITWVQRAAPMCSTFLKISHMVIWIITQPRN